MNLRLRHVIPLAVMAALATDVPESPAIDCPHCPGDPDNESPLPAGDFGSQVCNTCHIGHNAPGGTLTNNALGINNLCQSCHLSGGSGTEVDTHASTVGTAGCDFCVYDFTVKCTSCHDPHGHKQPINNLDDPNGLDPPYDYLFEDQIAVSLGGASCVDACLAGESADPASPDGSCIADPSCSGACVGQETCDNSSGTIVCTCPVKFDPTDCNTCSTGYTTPGTCDTLTVDCASASQGAQCGFGTCQPSGGPDCSGECNAGEYNDPKNNGICTTDQACPACSGDSVCAVYDGETVCECPPGYASGQSCNPSFCRPGFDGPNCTVDCNITGDGNPCGEGGTCVVGGGGGPNSLNGTSAIPTGIVTNPNGALSGSDGDTAAAIDSGNSNVVVAGFPGTDLGTITDVTVYVRYRTSAAPNDDSWQLDAAIDGSTFNQTIVAANTNHQASYTTTSLSLGVISWAQVGTLAIRGLTSKTKGGDGYSLDIEHAFTIVTTSGGGVSCDISGGCNTGWAGPNCDQCDTGAGYLPWDGGCTNACATFDCGAGSCYIDSSGNPECDCPNTYYGSGTGCSSCDSSFAGLSCECPAGYGPPGLCNTCAAGYHPEDGTCVADSAGVCSGYSCSNGGTCIPNDKSGDANAEALCDCTGRYFDDTGAAGSDCNSCTATGGFEWRSFTLSGTYDNATVNMGTNSFADGDNTVDGLCEVCHSQTTHHRYTPGSGNGPVAHNAGQNCMQSGCHTHVTANQPPRAAGFGFMPVQGSQTCDDCHLSPAGGGQDVESYRWNGVKAMIDQNEWINRGHGGTAFGGDFDTQGGGERGCAYCHDANIGHQMPGNPFRLANYDTLGRGMTDPENDVCLVCHSRIGSGYDPDGGGGTYDPGDSSREIDIDTDGVANHGDHGGNLDLGGRLCWDCHDPHGDTSAATGFAGNELWFMMQRYPVKQRDADGRPLDSDEDDGIGGDGVIEGLAAAVAFEEGIAGDPAKLDMDDFRHADAGLCRNCHTTTGYHSAGSATNVHPENKSGWTSTDTCVTCHPHELKFAGQAGAEDNCYSCHMSGQGADLLSYSPGTTAAIEEAEYGISGHFRSGSNYPSGNRPAAFTSSGGTAAVAGTCAYCHNLALDHPANTPYALGNVFMLANIDALARGNGDPENDVCLVCHGDGVATGYDPPANGQGDDPPMRCDAGEVGGPCLVVGTAHYTGKHGDASQNAGKFCWNCHDPHGDGNDYMVQLNLFKNLDVNGSPVNETIGAGSTTGLSANVDFRLAKGGLTNTLDFPDYKGAGDSLCGNCHDPTYITKVACTWTDCTTAHNDGGTDTCTSCHSHSGNFIGEAGCLGCHGTDSVGEVSHRIRRPIGPDFEQGTTAALTRSHHVGTGVAPPGAAGSFMGGALTDFDCVVCHAEGYIDATSGEVKTSDTYHYNNLKAGNRTIDLRDADSPDTSSSTPDVFSFDKTAIGANWDAGDAGWVAQTSNNLDPFCLTCHDADGASTAYQVGEHDGSGALGTPLGSAGNPFNDDSITNEYDRQQRPSRAGAPDAAGSVVDIDSMVTDYGLGYPQEGQFSLHAIRGRSVSRYNDYTNAQSMWNYSRFVNTGITEPEADSPSRPQWNDESVMSCADCHTTDGANGSSGNAHGSNSEYLLRDSLGNATEGDYDEGTSTYTYVCFQCHDYRQYNRPTEGVPDESNHGGNDAEFTGANSRSQVGAARLDGMTGKGASIFGMNCLNCHGGSSYGKIHGTSEVLPNGSGGTHDAYRFMNGSSMRFYDPQGWTTNSTACYTLSNADSFGACTQHSRNSSSKARIVRPLSY